MRLVDIDALRDRFSVAEICEDCKRDGRYCDTEIYSARDICGVLDDEPVVKAITLDWLNQKYDENDPDGSNEDYDWYLRESISYVLTVWKEDQEENE